MFAHISGLFFRIPTVAIIFVFKHPVDVRALAWARRFS